jgi:hypothetical protein
MCFEVRVRLFLIEERRARGSKTAKSRFYRLASQKKLPA